MPCAAAPELFGGIIELGMPRRIRLIRRGGPQTDRDRVSAMHDHGLEVRHTENLREHYAITLAHWGSNLEQHWAEAVAEAHWRDSADVGLTPSLPRLEPAEPRSKLLA